MCLNTATHAHVNDNITKPIKNKMLMYTNSLPILAVFLCACFLYVSIASISSSDSPSQCGITRFSRIT